MIIWHVPQKRMLNLPISSSGSIISINTDYNMLQRTLASIKSTAVSTETILNDKCMNLERKIHDYNHNITRMEEEKRKLEIDYKESLKLERDKVMQVI